VVAKDQVAPFQTVANAPCTLTGLAALPTAAQVVMLKQSTPNSWLSSLVDVFGLVVIVQVDPFHDSTNVWNVPDASVPPTASQKAEPMHETPFRRARSAPVSVGFGLGMMVHVAPFHSSVSVLVVVPAVEVPTAMQKVAEVHDTPFSTLTVAA